MKEEKTYTKEDFNFARIICYITGITHGVLIVYLIQRFI